jgi:hemerythrin-like domain-containing protein
MKGVQVMINVVTDQEVSLEAVGQQALMEHEILKLVVAALRLSLDWDTASVGLPKKLSAVRFTAESFQRHLERLIDLEESGGYMQLVRERQPALHSRAVELRREHDVFRGQLQDLIQLLRNTASDDMVALESACQDLRNFLARLDQHHLSEIDLLQEAAERDFGGEG